MDELTRFAHHLTQQQKSAILQMIFAMQELPGEFTTFDFIPGIPAPFNFGLAILKNQKMLTLLEKIQTAPPLIPMLIEGQPFIDAQVQEISTFLISNSPQNST